MTGPIQDPLGRLGMLARHQVPEPPPPPQRCDLCSEQIGTEHRHLLETNEGEICCACQACGILFDHQAAGGGHYRAIPRLRKRLDDFVIDDVRWAALEIPVDMAFFVRHDADPLVTAHYPSPLGTVGAAVTGAAWERLAAVNPRLGEMDTEVVALLVRRTRGFDEQWLLGIDDCYRLTAQLRDAWVGMNGGDEVWRQVDAFFERLRGNKRSKGKEWQWAASESVIHK